MRYRTSRQSRASLGNLTPGRGPRIDTRLIEPVAACPQCGTRNSVARLKWIGCITCGQRVAS